MQFTHLKDALQRIAQYEPDGAGEVQRQIDFYAARNTAEDYFSALECYEDLFSHVSTASFAEEEKRCIDSAFMLAAHRHRTQHYGWNGMRMPYAYHLATVSLNTLRLTDDDLLAGTLALWHDMLEDKQISEGELETKLKEKQYHPINSHDCIDTLNLLDRNRYTGDSKGRTAKYYEALCKNETALQIKAGDLMANMNTALKRYDEILASKKKHVIAKYIIETNQFLFTDTNFKSAANSQKIERKLTDIAKDISKKIDKNAERDLQKLVTKRCGYDFSSILESLRSV